MRIGETIGYEPVVFSLKGVCMLTYQEVIDRVQNARRFGNLPGIEITRVLLDKLGHPEQGIPFIHVAGTNGKGSTCAFLGSILSEAGYKVGIFTSPHLIHFEERITINGEMIPKETVERLGNLLLAMDLDVHPTMFDYCLVMAMLYFKEQKCNLVILETGLGGSKDSTTAVGTPLVSVITKIGLDHTEILGDTLAKIAGEKAGILKKGTQFVMEQQEDEAAQTLVTCARKVGIAQKDIHVITEKDMEWVAQHKLGLQGVHQVENAAAAVLAIRCISKNFSVLEEQLIRGLEKARWRGRLEVLTEQPFLMIDGAHNGHGVRALKQSLERIYPNQKFHFIMGVMADKDYLAMIECLLPLAFDFVTVTPDSSRALQSEELAVLIEERGVNAHSVKSIEEVFEHLEVNGRSVAFGSLYFIGELLEVHHKKYN